MTGPQDEREKSYREGNSISPNELHIEFGIPREEIASFRNVIRVYPSRETIITEGDQEKVLYLLRAGIVEVFKGSGEARKSIGTIDAVNFFGEMSMINDEPRAATVIASTEHVVVYRIPQPNIQSILTNPKWAELLLTRLTKNLARALEQNSRLNTEIKDLRGELDTSKKELTRMEPIIANSARNIRLAFNGILHIQHVIQGTAVVGSKGWGYLNALSHVTRNLISHYFSHIDQSDRSVDIQVIRRAVAAIPHDDQSRLIEDLDKLI